MTITLKRTVNLSEPVLPEVLSAPLYEGEKNAHTFMITAEKDKLPYALSGAVVAYFERNDGNTVRVEGETKDGAAILTLSPECYQTGVFYLAVMLISDGAQTVIYAASGRVRNTQDGEIIDGGNTIPTYDEIIAHLNKYLSTDITAKVEKTEDGARITMKDVVNGETTAVVKNGKSAYEVAVDNGFKGTQEEWLDSLKGDENIFVVHVAIDENYNYIADKTADEVRAAVNAGKLPAMFESGGDIRNTYLYCGEKTLNSVRLPYFQTLPLDGANGHKVIMAAYLKNDKTVEANAEFPMTAVTENKLTIKYGDQETKFDGSKPETVSIKDDLFVIRIDTSNKSDKTQAEVRAAAAAGKCLVLIDAGSGRTALYAGEFADKNDPSGMRPGFITQMRNDGQDIDYALSYYYLNADGKFTVKTHKPVETPTPLPLTIKTADKTICFDGSSEESIDLTGLGSGGKNIQDVFWVNITGSEASASNFKFDKSDEEIIAAHKSGKIVLGKYKSYIWYLAIYHEGENGAESYTMVFKGWGSGGDLANLAVYYRLVNSNDESLGYERQIVFYYTDFATSGEIPTTLPNRYPLTITDPNGNTIAYDGKVPHAVSFSSIPWKSITGKPFGDTVIFDQQITFTEKQILIPAPFALREGVKYTITAGNPANGGMSFTGTAIAGNADGTFDYVGIGNPGIFGVGDDNGEPYVFFSITGGLDMDGVKVYGMLAVTDQLFAMVQGATLPVKVELADGATPVPEELIPTMSETTKGGAKVGKGLVMDGDTLNVDEGVYELIETIALEEDVARVVRTNELNGTQLKLRDLYMRIISPVYTENRRLYINIGNSNSGSVWENDRIAYFNHEKIINTTGDECRVIAKKMNEKYVAVFNPPSAKGASVNLQSNNPMVSDGYVCAIRIFPYNNTTNAIPAGTVIEIWGVRA